MAVIFSGLGIAVPLLFHALGLGSMFLPMYLPLAIGAFLLSRVNALIAGFFTPLISALLTGMPPFYPPVAFIMMLQLAVFCFAISLMTHRFKFGVVVSLAVAVLLDRLLLIALFYLVYPLFSIDSRIITLYDLLKSLPESPSCLSWYHWRFRVASGYCGRIHCTSSSTGMVGIMSTDARHEKAVYFHGLAHGWDEKVGNNAGRREKLKSVFEMIMIRDGDRVLDVGCGSGVLFSFVERKTGPGGTIVAIDSAAGMIERAKELHRDLGNIEYRVGFIEDAGFQDGEFDVALCYAFFAHRRHPTITVCASPGARTRREALYFPPGRYAHAQRVSIRA